MLKSLLILLFLFSCSNSPTKKVITETVEVPIEAPIEIYSSFYVNKDTRSWVGDVIKTANCITINKNFHKDILSHGSYEHYTGSNKAIVKSLLSNKVATVGTYYKKYSVWPKRTSVRAYRNIGSNKIYINRANVSNKADANLVNTFIHERLHVLGYGHKGNKKYKYNNINSVPYAVGAKSEKYFKQCNFKDL